MRIATEEDIPELLEMAMELLAVAEYQDYLDEQSIENLLRNLITSSPKEKIVLIKPGVGFIAGISLPFHFGPHLLATELGWWVKPEYQQTGEGLALLEAFEYWAKNIAECKLITTASLDKKVEKSYRKKGYKLFERAYMKEL